MDYQSRIIRRYSQEFKAKVINDLSCGKFPSIAAVARHYGINRYETVTKWLRQAGKINLLPKIVVVELGDQQEH